MSHTNASIVRLAVLVAAMYAMCCALALGQQTPTLPTREPVSPAQALAQSNGSLLGATLIMQRDANQAPLSQVSYFAVPEPEPRTIQKHDLVTIIVREESEISSSAATDFKKQAEINARLEEFIKLSLSNWAIQGGAQGDNPPAIAANAERSFSGEAADERTDSMMLRLTAEVIDVKPNNTLVLQAQKQIRHNEEHQFITLTGMCRAEDVSTDNSVLSTQLANVVLVKNEKGGMRDATKRGWIPKLLDVVNPF